MSALLTLQVVQRVWARLQPMIATDMETKYGIERTQLAVRMGFVGDGEPLFATAVGDVWNESGQKYAKIAESKFGISARTTKRTRDVRACELLPGETLFYGSEVVANIVVGCSGCFPEDDELYATWFAAALRAEAERVKRALEEQDIIWVSS